MGVEVDIAGPSRMIISYACMSHVMNFFHYYCILSGYHLNDQFKYNNMVYSMLVG